MKALAKITSLWKSLPVAKLLWVWLAGSVALGLVLVLAWYLWRARVWRERRLKAPRLPVVLAHGLLGFDELGLRGRRFHYFRQVSGHLTRMGIAVYRPRVAAASSIAVRAQALADYLRVLPEPRVNLIAHSMGGLDARYAIAKLGVGDKVASLTTLGTPHRGTPLADLGTHALVGGLPLAVLRRVMDIEALWDLTTAAMEAFNREVRDVDGVAYGCVLAHCRVPFINPLLLPTYGYLRARFGENDGVVPVSSQRWGEVLREVVADHWAEIGWTRGFDQNKLFREVAFALSERGL